MESIFEALADLARRVTEAISDFLEAVRATFTRCEERRRSLVRRRDALAMVPVDPMWPDRRPHRAAYRREPHIRVRPGDIPDRYGNYPY